MSLNERRADRRGECEGKPALEVRRGGLSSRMNSRLVRLLEARSVLAACCCFPQYQQVSLGTPQVAVYGVWQVDKKT